MYLKHFLFFFIITSANNLLAQTDYLNRLGGFLIGPENVDVFHDTQSEYYIERYQNLRDNILIEKEDNLETIRSLEKKRLQRSKTIEEIAFFKKSNTILDAEIVMVDRYLKLWSAWEVPVENTAFLNAYDAKKCYQIDGPEFTYFPSEYRLDTLEQGSEIEWKEKVEQRMLEFEFEVVEVEQATEKWEKKRADRNCLSADPNDCLVWALVEIPAKYDTIVIQEAALGCIDGFLLDKYGEECEQSIVSGEQIDATLEIKIMDLLTGREIKVKQFELVECH